MLRYTDIGSEYTGTDEGKKQLNDIISRLEWLSIPKKGEPPINLPMAQGLGLKGIINSWKIPAVAIAHDVFMEGFALLAVKTRFGQEIYFVDEGSSIVPVALTTEEK